MDIKEFASLGGKARAAALTAEKRKQIATKASHARKYYLASKDADKPHLASKIKTNICKRGTNYYQCSVHNQPLTMCVQQGYSLE